MGWIGTRKELIEKYGEFIVNQCKGTGILPGTLITQLIVESQGRTPQGNYLVGYSLLSQNANNYFGIKCGSNWKGASYKIKSAEEDKNGVKNYPVSCFRKYRSIEESIKDYIRFLKVNSNYKKAGFFEQTTVTGQFKALKAAGYATGNDYVNLLIGVYKPLAPLIDNIQTTNPIKKAIVPILTIFAAMYYIYDTKIR